MHSWTLRSYNTPITRSRVSSRRCPINHQPRPSTLMTVLRTEKVNPVKVLRAMDMNTAHHDVTCEPVAAPSTSGRRASFNGENEIFVFDSIEAAVNEIAAGRFVVVLDDAHRENEGDLVAAADLVTPQRIAFMVEHTSGVICVGMEGHDLDRLKLPLMVPPSENTDAKCTAFTITVDLRVGTTTGISASDRAKTFNALANPVTQPSDFRRPGHIFPLRYEEGGVLKRRGHTEASVDLARLAGSYPAGVLCEIVDRSDGSMARTPQLFEFARRHGLKIITIEDLAQYITRHERTRITNSV